MRVCTSIVSPLLVSLFCLGSAYGQDFEFYKKPTNPAEYWRALQFEISVGKFDIAANHLKGLLDAKPSEKDLLEIEAKSGLVAFLQLRNVERWSRAPETDKEAHTNVETLIQSVSEALKKELSNPDRITKFAKNLTATPEEAAFALKELTRSGVAAIPVLIDLLRANQPADQRSGILEALPAFDISVVPALVASLDASEATLKIELLDALRKRQDYLTFSSRVETDLMPYLWYLSAPLPKNPELLRKKASEMLVGLLGQDPNADRIEEHRLPQYRLTQIAQTFLNHQARFNTPDQAAIWKWDGRAPVLTPMSLSDAEEYYGLRYLHWALEMQSDYRDAQKTFLTLALDKHFARAGADTPLNKSSPSLYAILATAPYDLLTELIESYLAGKRLPSAVALIEVLGDRRETRAIRPSEKLGAAAEARSSLLLRALDYPDRHVRFAAVDAILKSPGPNVHQRAATIVKILAGYLQADAVDDGGKPRALIGDPDRVRAELLAGVLRQTGFRVETLRTGRELIRRLQTRADVDLIVLDHHIPDPLFAGTMAQLQADFRISDVPIAVVASPDKPTTAHPITLLGRLAALSAAHEHVENAKAQRRDFESGRELPANRFKQRLDTLRRSVESAGIAVSADVEDRLEFLTYLTAPVGEMALPLELTPRPSLLAAC